MKANNTISATANLKGMAKHTYNRVMSAMAEDNTAAMLHAFAALTDGAKAIALQSGKFSNLYIRGERKGMAAEEAAKELTDRAAAGVSRKLRKIDMVCAIAFLAEYITRQRKADEPTTTEPTDNTPLTMNTNETAETLVKCYGDNEMITKANELKNAGYTRVANAYWVEHWQKDNALVILERCYESKRPAAETPVPAEPTATPAKAKTMQEMENQALRLTDRNWRRRNTWESSETSKAAKINRDKLIDKAYLNAAAKHLTAKAREIDEFLSVRPVFDGFCVALEYNSPSAGVALKIASPFCIEAFLNNPDQVLAKLNAR